MGLFIGTATFAAGNPAMTNSPTLAGSLTTTSVVVTGYYQNSPDQVWFEYGTSTQFGMTSPIQSVSNAQGPMQVTLSGLTPNTTYYYRSVGQNGSGMGYGTPIRNFKTLSVVGNTNSTPVVAQAYASNISYTSATLNGIVNANGNTNQVATITYNGNVLVSQTIYGTSNTTLSTPLSGLAQGTTYSFSVCIGTVCQTASFTTLSQNIQQTYACNDGIDNDGDGLVDMNDIGCSSIYDTSEYNTVIINNNYTQPSVTTYSATSQSNSNATLNGYISSNGGFASRYFQYGTNQYSLNYTTPTVYVGNTSLNVSEAIYNLQPNTTYYFRLVGQNNNGSGLAYGQTLSFITSGSTISNNSSMNTLTTSSTFPTQSSLRLNGLALSNNNASAVTGWFEWGTSAFSLTNETTHQNLGATNSIAFSDTLTGLARDTTYYYRAVAQNSNGISKGEIMFGRTLNTTVFTPVPTNPTTPTTTISGGTVRTSYIAMSLKTAYETVSIGETVDYTLFYKNISETKTLNKVVVRVTLPRGVTFSRASQGTWNEADSTLSVELGTLIPGQEGTLSIQGVVNRNVQVGDLIVTTAAIVYTDASNDTQGDAIAYVSNRVINNGNGLAAAAIFGYGFFPTTFLGWLLLIILLILLVYFGRKLYVSSQGRTQFKTPPAHN